MFEISQLKTLLPYLGGVPGRPQKGREAIARAFVAKADRRQRKTRDQKRTGRTDITEKERTSQKSKGSGKSANAFRETMSGNDAG